jgi:hypothetical protein
LKPGQKLQRYSDSYETSQKEYELNNKNWTKQFDDTLASFGKTQKSKTMLDQMKLALNDPSLHTGSLVDYFVSKFGWTPEDAQATFKQLTDSMTLAMNTGSMAGMTVSEWDMFRNTLPDISKSKHANRQIIETLDVVNSQQQDYLRFIQDYGKVTKYESPAEGLRLWDKYIKDNPVLVKDKNGMAVPNKWRLPYQDYFRATEFSINPKEKEEAEQIVNPDGTIVYKFRGQKKYDWNSFEKRRREVWKQLGLSRIN